jgi:hypothetical protein
MSTSIVIDLCAVVEEIKQLEMRVVALRQLMSGVPGGAVATAAVAEAPKRGRGRPKKERDPNKPKREANVWIKFTQRVDAALKEAGLGFKRVAESKKFAKTLKDAGGYECTVETILKARAEWKGDEAAEGAATDVPALATAAAVAVEAAAPAAEGEKKRGRKPKAA